MPLYMVHRTKPNHVLGFHNLPSASLCTLNYYHSAELCNFWCCHWTLLHSCRMFKIILKAAYMESSTVKKIVWLGLVALVTAENQPRVNCRSPNWGQFNKEIQVSFTSRTLVFTNSHQLESTKSLYKFPLEASNVYLQWYSIGFNQL